MACFCSNCDNLDMSKKKNGEYINSVLFGCKKHGYVCGWVDATLNIKTQLSHMGCSDFEKKAEYQQLSLF